MLPLVGGQGGLKPIRNLGVQLTLLQPDYVHHITASPPGFENPAASLKWTMTFIAVRNQSHCLDKDLNGQKLRQTL